MKSDDARLKRQVIPLLHRLDEIKPDELMTLLIDSLDDAHPGVHLESLRALDGLAWREEAVQAIPAIKALIASQPDSHNRVAYRVLDKIESLHREKLLSE